MIKIMKKSEKWQKTKKRKENMPFGVGFVSLQHKKKWINVNVQLFSDFKSVLTETI